MRLLLLLPLLAVPPLAAQSAAIAPAPSALFRVSPMIGVAAPGDLPAPAHVPIAPVSGLRWWQGGLIGAGVGGTLGAAAAYLFFSDRIDCEDCTEPHKGRPYATVIGVGAVLGFMLGGNLAQPE